MKTYVTTIVERHEGFAVYNRVRVPSDQAHSVALDTIAEMIGEDAYNTADCVIYNGFELCLKPNFSFLNDFGEQTYITIEQFGASAQEKSGMFRYG